MLTASIFVGRGKGFNNYYMYKQFFLALQIRNVEESSYLKVLNKDLLFGNLIHYGVLLFLLFNARGNHQTLFFVTYIYINIKVKDADLHMYILMIQWLNKWIILVNVLYIEICHIFLLPKKIIFIWPKSMLASVDLWESSVSASLKINRRIQLLWIMHSK